jgi:hypothetical protein
MKETRARNSKIRHGRWRKFNFQDFPFYFLDFINVPIIRFVRLPVFSESTIKSTVFWDVKPCSLVEIYRLFGERTAYIFRIEEEAKQAALPDHTASHSRRQYSL